MFHLFCTGDTRLWLRGPEKGGAGDVAVLEGGWPRGGARRGGAAAEEVARRHRYGATQLRMLEVVVSGTCAILA